ncbi:LysM peptidoglycan-binding domain-containing protein [Xylophilus sp. Leaf220]|uniref:LysM peptidoglycan-binding domain-containing protein n=1 Tax=Xylophilus sp. Leaf220 TaxID=1735686 RepID=UPI0006F521E4|nr:peptidoglycan-binding protein [Xylophilus sp. Leaf220]
MRMKSPCAAVALAAAALCCATSALAQNYPVTPTQRATAQQVAQTGIPVAELSPNAPDVYVVKRGDTLWAISGMYLQRPWRWPELWGMNLEQIRNPHLIYPGQTLYLEKVDGMARLRTSRSGYGGEGDTVRISPRTRYESLADSALPTLQPQFIEPFLAEPLIVDEFTLKNAPRLVGALEERVLLARGDRAYALGPTGAPLMREPGQPRDYRVFRNAVPLKDPATAEILGYEAQYVGRARLMQSESTQTSLRDGKDLQEIVPASFDIVGSKEEMRAGDRLLPEPPRQLVSYNPRAPQFPIENGRVVSIYGSAVANAAQNQIVAINKGTLDGMESGHVLAILSEGPRITDRTGDKPTQIKLPDERNGLMMVFRTFERVSYALILEIRVPVKTGDRLIAP